VGRTRIGAVAMACAFTLQPAAAETYGGTLRIYNSSNPPSASPHEDTTIAVVMPFMAVYNNLVRYDPVAPRNSVGHGIRPDTPPEHVARLVALVRANR
jgi:peptide/nickel transport system substrate-binding protein